MKLRKSLYKKKQRGGTHTDDEEFLDKLESQILYKNEKFYNVNDNSTSIKLSNLDDIDVTDLKDNTIYVYDSATKELSIDTITLQPIEHDHAIIVNTYIYDINSIARWSLDKTKCPLRIDIKLKDRKKILEKYNKILNINSFEIDKKILCMAISPNGNILAIGSADKTIFLWDIAKREMIKKINEKSMIVQSVAFSPDGNTLATGSFGSRSLGDGIARIWNVTTGKCIKKFQDKDKDKIGINLVALSPDGNTLATLYTDKTIGLWNVNTGKLVKILSKGRRCLVFSPDSKTLAIGDVDHDLTNLWDLSSYKIINKLIGDNEYYPIVFSPNGQFIAVTCYKHKYHIFIYDITIKPDTQIVNCIELNFYARSLSFSPDGNFLAAGGRYSDQGNLVKIWDFNTSKLLNVKYVILDPVRSLAFSPDGKNLVIGNENGKVTILDFKEDLLI